jgi:hypothetical protein
VVCPVIFIIMAAIAVGGLMIPLATLLWPDPSKTPAIAFVSLLALAALLTIGFGLPLAMVWGGVVADWFGTSKEYTPDGEDAALAAKVHRQLWRLIAVMCILLIPGTMMFVIFNIDIGPVLIALKIATGVCILIGAVSFHKSRRSV